MTKTRKKSVVKQSLLMGALASSFGVFVSKALGLLYYSPLSSLAGESNMAFYSITYTYYDILLKISQAGIPFAIAALVAKYVAKEDYKTALVTKKLGTSIVMGISFISVIFFILFSAPLARQSMGSLATEKDVQQLKNLFLILIIAVILVPYLSAIRSYYQGLKRLDLYASSQVLEQLVRVITIIVLGYIFVKVLNFESIWAIYMAIAAAGIAAAVAIVFFKMSTKSDDARIASLVKGQESDALTRKEVFKEILYLGLPYLGISILGSSSPLINTTFFLDYVTTVGGMDQATAQLSLGIFQANCSKLNAIPQVLTSGFCTGLVPFLTESYEQKDYKKLSKQVLQIIDTVLYILIPVLVIMTVFAKDIYYIMYGASNLTLATSLFRASNARAFTETVLPILSSVMITLRFRKVSILTLLNAFIVKTVTFFIFVKFFWAYGMAISTCISSIISMSIYFVVLHKSFNINFMPSLKRSVITGLCSFIMVLPAALLHAFMNIDYTSRLMCIVIMGLLGIIMLLTYFEVGRLFRLPQVIFDVDDISLKILVKRFKGRNASEKENEDN